MTAARTGGESLALRMAVVGKGGVGKSCISATIALTLARRGHRVLVLDHDSVPGISLGLGMRGADEPLLNAAMVQGEDRRLRFAEGLDPVTAARRFAIDGPDGIRVLQVGKNSRAGGDAVQASVNAFYTIASHLGDAPEFSDWTLLGDVPAGGRQTACGWTPYANHYLLVVEATAQSMFTARRIKRIVQDVRPDARVSLVVSKVTGPSDVADVSGFLDMPAFGVVPLDEQVRIAERAGIPLLEHAPDSAAVAAVVDIAERLEVEDEPISGAHGAVQRAS